jgi:hypothetical protein
MGARPQQATEKPCVCHPERSEGSAFCFEVGILRVGMGTFLEGVCNHV